MPIARSDIPVVNEVVVGRDRELFLASTVRDTIGFLVGERAVPQTHLDAFRTNLEGRAALAASIGARYLHVVAPDKHHVYEDWFPVRPPFSFAEHYRARTGARFLYLKDVLQAALPERVYHQTDTHWNAIGTVIAIAEVARKLKVMPPTGIDAAIAHLRTLVRTADRPFMGDLGNKLSPQQTEPGLTFVPDWRFTEHDNGVNHNDGVIRVVSSDSPVARGKLLIFGDSYMLLSLPVLSYFFREILCCRSRFMHAEIVGMARPNFIVTENVERYFDVVRADAGAPPLFLIPFLQERSVSISPEAARAFVRYLRPPKPRPPKSPPAAAPPAPAPG